MHARAIRENAHELPAKPGILGDGAPIEQTIKSLAIVSRFIRNFGLQDKRTIPISWRGRFVLRPAFLIELAMVYGYI